MDNEQKSVEYAMLNVFKRLNPKHKDDPGFDPSSALFLTAFVVTGSKILLEKDILSFLLIYNKIQT